ncbi:cell division protein ZipA [Testudinibacter sp. P80/BLE/0925]|uniref:cell division protein ZipA n=1 Tax=Testudinibacter sp. TW-1 TaxID=3417757 RepID=UPI003D37010B
MDSHIILIILIVLILVILVAHGLWSSRREKSQLFKSANTFTYDSRTEGQDLPDRHPQAANAGEHGYTTPETSTTAANTEYSTQAAYEAPQQARQETAQAPVSVEQAVSKIRITLPQATQAVASAVATTQSSNAESLSRSSLLNRTIADLEQEIDSEEGINTSSTILREELAKMTQQNKINITEPIVDTAPINPTSAAESVRARLNPQPVAVPNEAVAGETSHAEQPQEAAPAAPVAEKPARLILYVVAPGAQGFQGTQVVQSLESLGFLFGQHQLYHRHLDLDGNSPILFSAANMMNPGIFDLDNLADFRTAGLVLFMHLPSPGSDLANFRLLLRAAQTLAQQLGGQVLNDKRQPFDESSKNHYLSLIN